MQNSELTVFLYILVFSFTSLNTVTICPLNSLSANSNRWVISIYYLFSLNNLQTGSYILISWYQLILISILHIVNNMFQKPWILLCFLAWLSKSHPCVCIAQQSAIIWAEIVLKHLKPARLPPLWLNALGCSQFSSLPLLSLFVTLSLVSFGQPQFPIQLGMYGALISALRELSHFHDCPSTCLAAPWLALELGQRSCGFSLSISTQSHHSELRKRGFLPPLPPQLNPPSSDIKFAGFLGQLQVIKLYFSPTELEVSELDGRSQRQEGLKLQQIIKNKYFSICLPLINFQCPQMIVFDNFVQFYNCLFLWRMIAVLFTLPLQEVLFLFIFFILFYFI